MKILLLFLIVCCLFPFQLFAQDDTPSDSSGILKSWHTELSGGFLLGGTSPLPIPQEIRHIQSFNPGIHGALEARITRWFSSNPHLGITTGLRLENMGMTTKSTVKNYHTSIINEGQYVSGYWTGGVKTHVNISALTLPLLLRTCIIPRFTFGVGPYISYVLDHQFSGSVYEGYLREGNPTGLKLSFENGKTADYDFSSSMRRLLWGFQGNVTMQVSDKWSAHAALTWGMNNIFQKDFHTVSFSMYPIYFFLGAAYAIN